MKKKTLCLFVLVMVLSACAPARLPAGTPSATDPRNSSGTPRWVLYERGLSDIFLGPPGRTKPDFSQAHGICEWEIFGQEEKEVYVWALCQVAWMGTATSAPAVIRLDRNGNIEEIVMSEEGNRNIREMFPRAVLERMKSFDGETAWSRLEKRSADPAIVPLIVEQGTPLP